MTPLLAMSSLSLRIFFITFIISSIFNLDKLVVPVPKESISINPVVGSVAACWVATFISLTASSMSSFVMTSANLILALASASLIIDSKCLGVAETIFLSLFELRKLI